MPHLSNAPPSPNSVTLETKPLTTSNFREEADHIQTSGLSSGFILHLYSTYKRTTNIKSSVLNCVFSAVLMGHGGRRKD